MDCHYHPGREGTDNCAICGKSICKECGLEIAGKNYCKDCLEKIVGVELDNSTPKETEETSQFEQTEYASIGDELTNDEMNYATYSDGVNYDEPSLYDAENSYETTTSYENEAPRESIIRDVLEKENNQEPNVHQFRAVEETSPYAVKTGGYNHTPEPAYEERSYYSQEPQYTSQNEPYHEPQFNQEPAYGSQPQYAQEDIYQERSQTYSQQPQYSQQRPPIKEDDGFIYPDHSYQPPTRGENTLEDKYEKYLDDLYFDDQEEPQIPLSQQLAQDEEEYGSLTMNQYTPKEAPKMRRTEEDIYYEKMMESEPYSTFETNNVPQRNAPPRRSNDMTLEDEIRQKIAAERQREIKPSKKSIHNLPSQKREKEPLGIVDIILTIILIVVILIVVFYIIYLFVLSASYPTFTDALYGLTDPQTLIGHLMGK